SDLTPALCRLALSAIRNREQAMNSIMPDLRYALRQLRKTPTYAQVDDKTMKAINGWFPTSFAIRVGGDAPLAAEAARALYDADSEVPVGKFVPKQSFVDETVAAPRFFAWMASGFAAFGLLLTTVGL